MMPVEEIIRELKSLSELPVRGDIPRRTRAWCGDASRELSLIAALRDCEYRLHTFLYSKLAAACGSNLRCDIGVARPEVVSRLGSFVEALHDKSLKLSLMFDDADGCWA
eukprot:6150372-Pleurochrysis_carterae.AAC.2